MKNPFVAFLLLLSIIFTSGINKLQALNWLSVHWDEDLHKAFEAGRQIAAE